METVMQPFDYNYKVVYTTGVFDLMHHGHINFLNEARKLGDWLVVGLVDDESVKHKKGPKRPILPWSVRRDLLLSLKCVGEVVYQTSFDPEPTIRVQNRQVDVIAKGEDQSHVSEEWARKNNIKIVYIKRTEGVSTTEMVNASNK